MQEKTKRIAAEIRETDYVAILEGDLREKRKKPVSVAFFLLSTVGQSLVVALSWMSGKLEGNALAALAALSLAMTTMACFNRYACAYLAKKRFGILRAAGKAPKTGTGKTEFLLHADSLEIRGEKSISLPAELLEIVQYASYGTMIKSGGEWIGGIPDRAFASSDERDAFLDGIRDAKLRASFQDEQTLHAHIPSDSFADYPYEFSKETFYAQERAAYRAIPRTALVRNPITVLEITLSLLTVCLMLMQRSMLSICIGLPVLVLLNLNWLKIYTLYIDTLIGRSLIGMPERFPDRKVHYYFGERRMYAMGSVFALSFPYEQIAEIKRFDGFIAIYLSKSLVFTVGKPQNMTEEAFAALSEQMKSEIFRTKLFSRKGG